MTDSWRTADDRRTRPQMGSISINNTPMELLGIEQTLERIEVLLKKLLEKK